MHLCVQYLMIAFIFDFILIDGLPVFMTFEDAEKACRRWFPNEPRCKNVKINYTALEEKPMPKKYTFTFGKLRFYVQKPRILRFGAYVMADYMLTLDSKYSYDYDQNNRLAIVYKADYWSFHGYGPARGWFSFVADYKYFSFNFIFKSNSLTLLKQHRGPQYQQFWDTTWIDYYYSDFTRYPIPPDNATDWVTNNMTRRVPPPIDPDKDRELQLRESDGLFQLVMQQFDYSNHTPQYKFFLLKGHRDWTTTTRISVTFQFTPKALRLKGFTEFRNYNQVMALIAIRTINELNGIFKRSGVLIKLYIHCIAISKVTDSTLNDYIVLNAYGKPTERKSSDLLIAFVHELHDWDVLSYTYRLEDKKAVVVVKSTSIFEIIDIAHEIGHVLGAGHTYDEYDPTYKSMIYYAYGHIEPSTMKCTIMSPQPCAVQPLFSNPRKPFEGITWGVSHLQDNAAWIKQNRFVWQQVGFQDTKCEQGPDLPHVPWLYKCLDLDVTDPEKSFGVFSMEIKCPPPKETYWNPHYEIIGR